MSFIKSVKKIINNNQSRSILITGNVYDLFYDGSSYVPLIEYLSTQLKPQQNTEHKGIIQLICRLNNPIEVRSDNNQTAMAQLEESWKAINGPKVKSLASRFKECLTNATFALELLRQVVECNRRYKKSSNNLLVIVESADLLIPESPLDKMSIVDRQRIAIVHDWFCDPAFIEGGDTVILVSESKSSIHHRIARLPQVLSSEIGLPDFDERKAYLEFYKTKGFDISETNDLANQMAGLSIYAIRQLVYSQDLTHKNISSKVEEYMIGQLGEDVVEFKRPKHKFSDVIGFSLIKEFMQEEMLPAFKGTGDEAISGVAVGGPIGCGKTYFCEAFASELGDVPVITLKNIRSKWFGETDTIFERVRRIISSFNKIVIFVDEADTQFGDLGSASAGTHDTERRLTGKIQAMMSDTSLRGKVIWFLMTARINLLSADIRRPGRVDLIIPIGDPVGNDKIEFCKWAFGDVMQHYNSVVDAATEGYSAAAFQALRAQIKRKKPTTLEQALDIAKDLLQPDIGEVRKYQFIQAQLNCTRARLLGNVGNINEYRNGLKRILSELESKGVK